MKYLIRIFLVLLPGMAWAQRFQLASPQVRVDSMFFRQRARILMEFDMDSTAIHYTLDGFSPSVQSPAYAGSLDVKQTSFLQARVTHPDFLPGIVYAQRLVQVAQVPDSLKLTGTPDSAYAGRGAAGLYDLQKGSRDLHDGRWIGFRRDSVVAEVKFNTALKCRRILVSTLYDPNAWVMPPSRIEVFGTSAGKPWRQVGAWALQDADWKDQAAKYQMLIPVMVMPGDYQRFRIRITAFGPLPAGQPGAGQPAWLFLDELAFPY